MEGELDAILLDPKNRRVYATHDHGKSVWVVAIEQLLKWLGVPEQITERNTTACRLRARDA